MNIQGQLGECSAYCLGAFVHRKHVIIYSLLLSYREFISIKISPEKFLFRVVDNFIYFFPKRNLTQTGQCGVGIEETSDNYCNLDTGNTVTF